VSLADLPNPRHSNGRFGKKQDPRRYHRSVRLTPAEDAQLVRLAELHDMTPGEYMRRTALRQL